MLKRLTLFAVAASLFASVASAQVVDFSNAVTASLPGNVLTGSGTSGRVAYWSGEQTVASSAGLVYDAANTRLGIGGLTPSSTLHVSGTSIFTDAKATQISTSSIYVGSSSNRTANLVLSTSLNNSTSGLYLTVGNFGMMRLYVVTGDAPTFSNERSGNIQFIQSGSGLTAMSINTANQSVGVGAGFGATTDPSATLHVSGTTRVNSLAGSGNGYVCADSQGNLYRSASPCI